MARRVRTMRGGFTRSGTRSRGNDLTAKQWGFVLTVGGAVFLVGGVLWPGIPTLDDGTLWNPWAWGAFLAGWAALTLGVLILWPFR